MPDGLEAWYVEQAAVQGEAVNGLIVAALEEYRERCGGATTTSAHAGSGSTAPAPPATFKPAATGRTQCPHPPARVHKGLCGACGTYVGTKESKR